MTYAIEYLTIALKEDIPKLDTAILASVKRAIETKLQPSAAVFGKPLRQSLRGHRSLRVENHRIVYRIETSVVTIIAIRHRRDVYPTAEARIR